MSVRVWCLSIFKRQIESGDFMSTIQDVLLEMPVQFYYKLQKKKHLPLIFKLEWDGFSMHLRSAGYRRKHERQISTYARRFRFYIYLTPFVRISCVVSFSKQLIFLRSSKHKNEPLKLKKNSLFIILIFFLIWYKLRGLFRLRWFQTEDEKNFEPNEIDFSYRYQIFFK